MTLSYINGCIFFISLIIYTCVKYNQRTNIASLFLLKECSNFELKLLNESKIALNENEMFISKIKTTKFKCINKIIYFIHQNISFTDLLRSTK